MPDAPRPPAAADICTRIVSVAWPSLSIEEAARVMRDQDVGALVIVEELSAEDRRVVGMLTDRDVALGVVAAQRPPQGLCVADLMSRPVITAREQDTVPDVLAAMRRHHVRRLPVVGPGDRLVGIVTVDDVLRHVADELRAVAGAVETPAPRTGPGRASPFGATGARAA